MGLSLPTYLLLVIFLEGYVVLSTELIAMRLVVPYVGSGTDTIAIIVAAVLLPLAAGYYAGGRFSPLSKGHKRYTGYRTKLLQNLIIATAILTIGLSYVAVEYFYNDFIARMGLKGRHMLTALYALTFLVPPVFLLGQTVPLASNFFAREKLSSFAGKVLFFSTFGSFLGAILSTVILMPGIGLHYTSIITVACLTLLTFILSKKIITPLTLLSVLCLGAAIFLNGPQFLNDRNIVAYNQYHMVQVRSLGTDERREMRLDGNLSSLYTEEDSDRLTHVKYIDETFLDSLKKSDDIHSILVIGAAGFTIGRDDHNNNYVYVDIDPALQDIAEKHLLKGELGANKRFEAKAARSFLRDNTQKFDLIIIDTFTGNNTIPEHLITREFFEQLKTALKDGGVITANYSTSANFSTRFSVRLDQTFRSVFPTSNRHVLGYYNGWWKDGDNSHNVVYSYFNRPEKENGIYTDTKNPSAFDRETFIEE